MPRVDNTVLMVRSTIAVDPPVASTGPFARWLPAAACGTLRGLPLAICRSRHTLRVLNQGDDQDQATDQQRPVAGDAQDRLEEVGNEALGCDQPTDHGARDHRDPTDVGERDEPQGDQDSEPGGTDRAEVVCVHPPSRTGDERRDGVGRDLHAGDVDARRRGGPLVGAHRQHLLAEHGAAQVGDEKAQRDHGDEIHETEHGARQLPVEPAERRVAADTRSRTAWAARPGSRWGRRPTSSWRTRTARWR